MDAIGTMYTVLVQFISQNESKILQNCPDLIGLNIHLYWGTIEMELLLLPQAAILSGIMTNCLGLCKLNTA